MPRHTRHIRRIPRIPRIRRPDAPTPRRIRRVPGRADGRRPRTRRDTAHVGFDPTRKHKRTRFDYVYVAASVIVFVALVVWALA
jgi:hypothetical protein